MHLKNLVFYLFLWLILLVSCTSPSESEDGQLTYDVCVYSGTSAGVAAAIAAAEEGKKVLLIEPKKHLGGMTASGLGLTDFGNKNALSGFSGIFYRKVAEHYGNEGDTMLVFEPHVAENIFNDLFAASGADSLLYHRVVDVTKEGAEIKSIIVENSLNPAVSTNKEIVADVFIDCSYEGDLLAAAGVSYTVGREANSQYNEQHNGVQIEEKSPNQFIDGIDPYIVPGDSTSGLVHGVTHADPLPEFGTGDDKVQAYNYRVCLTDVPENRIPITKPEGYDPAHYELLARAVEKEEWVALGWGSRLPFYRCALTISEMPNGKTDINNYGGFSTDYIGESWEYPEASYERRAEIEKEHENYLKGLFYFIGHSERVPKKFRDEMLAYGYPKDEFTDNGGWPFQLYVREARRMVGEYVMTEHNWYRREVVDDGIAIGSYGMDSHNVQRVVINGMVKNEGDVQVWTGVAPYPISYRCMLPKKGECTNLVVPVCVSASHIAYGSIRMEPVFMMMGEAAGMAAAMADEGQKPLHEIDVPTLQQKIGYNFQVD